MAPLFRSHDELPSAISAILTNIHKRSSTCGYYDGSCNDPHRYAVLVVILLFGFLIGLVFTLIYFQSRRRRMLIERQARIVQEQMELREERNKSLLPVPWHSPPPPYMPTIPETAARGWR